MDYNKFLISDFGERELIKIIIDKAHSSHSYFNKKPEISKSLNVFDTLIGDDAALIDLNDFNSKDSYLVASTDMLIQDKHFPKKMAYFYMGWKAVTVNISDISAMGADALGILISLAVPQTLTIIEFKDLVDGIVNACCYYDIPLLGGDLNESSQVIISGTAFAKVDRKNKLKKYPFKKGDRIALTGPIGLSAAGTEYSIALSSGLDTCNIDGEDIYEVLYTSLKPIARLKEGKIASNSEFVSACTDITDGLVLELYDLLDSNTEFSPLKDLGFKIYEDKLPIPKSVYNMAELLETDPLELALHYGEDFELIFIVKEEYVKEMTQLLNLNFIGEVSSSSKVEMVRKNGEIVTLDRRGYEHLSN